MDAKAFVKTFGLKQAKKILKNNHQENNSYFFWCNHCGNGGSSELLGHMIFDPSIIYCTKCNSENLNCDDHIDIRLQELVTALKLINKHYNLDAAKHDLMTAEKTKMTKIWGTPINDLREAIQLVDDVKIEEET